jgi:hypothetical protein
VPEVVLVMAFTLLLEHGHEGMIVLVDCFKERKWILFLAVAFFIRLPPIYKKSKTQNSPE